jgi:uncharacterized ion transporter superfamily protein YfcC
MEQKAGAQISQKAFLQSFNILLVLILLAGLLTVVVPSGTYQRSIINEIEVIDPLSFTYIPKPDYPFWRWLIAPFEVLGGPDNLTIITILLFLLMVGASFAVLDHCGILRQVISGIVHKFGAKKYLLLLIISLFFMVIGGFFGIFEEVIPLVPIMVALSLYLGWDSLVGLGMSILAVNMGFSAAISNPFTIVVAQRLSGLPLFSGAGFRLVVFAAIYLCFAFFLVRYAKKVERDPASSPVYQEDQKVGNRFRPIEVSLDAQSAPHLRSAATWFLVCILLIAAVLFVSPFIAFLSSYSLPIVALLFLIAGLGAGFLSGINGIKVWKVAWQGVQGIAPGVPLILMAASIKYIISQGAVLDTILSATTSLLSGIAPWVAALVVYGLALVIEFFIGSGSAKAFLLMPILIPLADMIGLTRQTAVMAYCFGDGFSNLIYPTSPVLLIALGLTKVSYSKWLRWSLRLWYIVFPLTILLLLLAVSFRFGPF